MKEQTPLKPLHGILSELIGGEPRTDLTIKELNEILTELIEQGHGDKEFQLYYDGGFVYTTIRKGSLINIDEKSVKFTDYL